MIIAGEGRQRGTLEALAEGLGLGDRVLLLGHREDTVAVYEAMDAFALSSLREGLPNALLEAMAMEVPVVATRVAGVPRLVEDGLSGLLVEPGSEDDLTRVPGPAAGGPCPAGPAGAAGARRPSRRRYSFEARMRKIRRSTTPSWAGIGGWRQRAPPGPIVDRRRVAMSRAGSPSLESSNLLGYDVVRLVAMGCVAAQHALSISDVEPPVLYTVNLGQLGVTLFCALSGVLALCTGGDPVGWLSRRLARICLPYWITLAAIFTANEIVHYKPVPSGLVVAEFLGIAYFTHPGSMVGVHVWFMSLLLVCYAIGVLIRWDRRLLPACAAVAVLLLPRDPGLVRHVLSFLAGMTVAVLPRPGRAAPGLALAALGCAAAVRPEFAYPLAGTTALLLGGLIRWRSPRAVALAGRATYEFFLVHGPIYLGLRGWPDLVCWGSRPSGRARRS